MSLSVNYHPGSTCLLPTSYTSSSTTTPSTPGLTPNASSTSSASSYSLATCPSLSSAQQSQTELEIELDTDVDSAPPGKHVVRTGSRPSLRHMPSWRSFASHLSRRSLAGKDDHGGDDESGSDGDAITGVYDDAEEFDPDTPGPGKTLRGRERGMTMIKAGLPTPTAERRSTRKGGNGSSGFAKALKKLSLGKLGSHIERRGLDMSRGSSAESSDTYAGDADTEETRVTHPKAQHTRVETPLNAPIPLSLIAKPSELAPVPSSPCTPSSPASPNFEDYFTPPTIPTTLLQAHASLPVHPSFPTVPRYSSRHTRKDWLSGVASTNAIAFPNANAGDMTPTPAPTPARETLEDSVEDTSSPFSIDIFSPRVHRAPVLRGIIDALPVSPLELPRSKSAFIPSLKRSEFPTPVLPRNATPSPIVNADGATTMPSLGQVVSSCSATSSPVRPGSSVFRLPRASIPSSSTAPNVFAASSFSHLPFTRRHSAIIRPPILPSPTPPSLITSPRNLGTPLIPPGPTSPSRLDTLAGAPPVIFSPIEATLPSTRIRRASAAVRVGAISPTAGLGFGAMSGAGSGFRDRSKAKDDGEPRGSVMDDSRKNRLATPGTFGLEGEAEKRMVNEGVNPYFA